MFRSCSYGYISLKLLAFQMRCKIHRCRNNTFKVIHVVRNQIVFVDAPEVYSIEINGFSKGGFKESDTITVTAVIRSFPLLSNVSFGTSNDKTRRSTMILGWYLTERFRVMYFSTIIFHICVKSLIWNAIY